MPEAVLGFGSNLGARRALIHAALELLRGQPGLTLLARSPLYATPALGPPQPDYLNAAARVRWPGSVESLFRVTQHVEQLLGRQRLVRWGARTIDIDLLYWSDGPIQTEALVVPHPELMHRNFALAPTLDVMPELRSSLGSTLQTLGGAPVLAEPGWPVFELWPDARPTPARIEIDATELACLVVGAVGACTLPRPPCAATLPFQGPATLFDERGGSFLLARADAARRHGFRVDYAAITEHNESRTRGVLIGAHTGVACALPALEPYVRRLGDASYELLTKRR